MLLTYALHIHIRSVKNLVGVYDEVKNSTFFFQDPGEKKLPLVHDLRGVV